MADRNLVEVMLNDDRGFRAFQRLAVVVVAAGWVYMLAFAFHYWKDRIWFGGLMIDVLTAGLLFERWRWRRDRLAMVPFFLAAAAFATAIIVSSISPPRELALAGVIAAAGAVAAWGVRGVQGRARAGDAAAGNARAPGPGEP